MTHRSVHILHRHAWCIVLLALLSVLAGCSSLNDEKPDNGIALRRALRAQYLRNTASGHDILPELSAIVDSMRHNGRDIYYYAAVNVLVDQLFSCGRFVEADSAAVAMLADAMADRDSIAMAMAARIRGQMFYKLSRPEKSLEELKKARSYLDDTGNDLREFSTSASVDEWIWMASRAIGDTASAAGAALRYVRSVNSMMASGWTDSTAHFPVSAHAFVAYLHLNRGNTQAAATSLARAKRMMLPQYPARAYEHYYEVRSDLDAAEGNYTAALASIDTLIATHRDFPWFRTHDLKSKALMLAKAEMYKESNEAHSEYVAMHDSLLASQVDRRLKDLTVLYRSGISREQRRAHLFMVRGLIGVASLLALLLAVAFISARHERRKNLILVERLRESDIHRTGSIPGNTPDDTSGGIERLDMYMAAGRPYTDPALNRRDLAAAMDMSQEDLASLIRSERGVSVLAYINAWRLDEARKLLEEDSNETIAGIASCLGFGTARTLQRLFRQRFGMSPSQYRDLAQDKNNTD